MKHLKYTIPALTTAFLLSLPAKAISEQNQASAEMCILDEEGAKRAKITLNTLFVQVFTVAMPDRYSQVLDQEDCEDPRDNNCNGEINEGCSPDVPEIDWKAGQDCAECMATKCPNYSYVCKHDAECQAAAACVVEHACMGDLAFIPCYCGVDVSIFECQSTTEKPQGPCVDELVSAIARRSTREQLMRLWGSDDVNLPKIPTGTLACLSNECSAECSELSSSNRP